MSPYRVITGVCGDSRLTVLLFCVCAVTFTQGGAIQLAGPGGEALQGVQALTLPSPATPQPGATILQYGAQPGDPGQQLLLTAGQMLVQGKTLQLINTFIVENTAFRQEEVKCIFQHVMIVIHFEYFQHDIKQMCVCGVFADAGLWSWKDDTEPTLHCGKLF